MLDLLRAEDAPSTFFLIADRAAAHPGLIERMQLEGHEIGFHCVRHVRHSELDELTLRGDVEAGIGMLASLGVEVRLWRPPWGVATGATRRVAAEFGMRLVGWDLDSHDWRGDAANEMHARIGGDMRAGSTVLMHDGLGPGARRSGCQETVALVVRLLETMRRRRLRPATIGEVVA